MNPANGSIQPSGQFNGLTVSIDAAGDRIAWPKSYLFCSQFTCNTDYAPYAVGVDGSGQEHVSGSSAEAVTFGDPAGNSELFSAFVDWNNLPAVCTGTSHRYALTLQTPAPDGGTPGTPAYYCVPDQDLVDPALSPDGQRIAAVAADIGGTGGAESLVTIPLTGVATAGSASPLTTVASAGTVAFPDFSPDGTQLAFEGAGNTIDVAPAAGGTPSQILTDATRRGPRAHLGRGARDDPPAAAAGGADPAQAPPPHAGDDEGGRVRRPRSRPARAGNHDAPLSALMHASDRGRPQGRRAAARTG